MEIISKELSFQTAKKVREIIIENKMRPGDKLPSESELIELFKVSRPTIREAMKILNAENIIDIQQGRGTFVSKKTGINGDPLGLSFADQKNLLKNLLEARLFIEPQITLLAAQRATDSQVKHLEEIITKMTDFNVHNQNSAELDLEFHTAIAKATGNDVLYRVVPIINESIMKGYGKTVNNKESFERAYESHVKIFNAIKNRDFLTAKYESERHIRKTLEDVFSDS
jgi:GntR family transcriptional regulator, transcriptional repressor for pyruvate dehydrogenase complex